MRRAFTRHHLRGELVKGAARALGLGGTQRRERADRAGELVHEGSTARPRRRFLLPRGHSPVERRSFSSEKRLAALASPADRGTSRGPCNPPFPSPAFPRFTRLDSRPSTTSTLRSSAARSSRCSAPMAPARRR